MTDKFAVLMMSGGLDSTVLLYWALRQNYSVLPLFIDYGQHCRQAELDALLSIMPSELISALRIVTVSDVFRGSPSRLIRETNLWQERIAPDELLLPYRNLFLLVAGSAYAASHGASVLLSAFINSNHAYEIDASASFLGGVESLVAGIGGVRLEMPFRNWSKTEVASMGLALGVPIGRTFSCQINSQEHCGACPNCVERLRAFNEAATSSC
jgi:7-cyano-7-deazaguanine synthase